MRACVGAGMHLEFLAGMERWGLDGGVEPCCLCCPKVGRKVNARPLLLCFKAHLDHWCAACQQVHLVTHHKRAGRVLHGTESGTRDHSEGQVL